MLKNYTSQVSAKKSIDWIEFKLSRNGATQILKIYDTKGRVSGIAFIVPQNGIDFPYKLPARIEECEKILKESLRKPRTGTLQRISEQAERTAWKIISDWVDAQMAMINLSQVKLMEIFLPFLYDHSRKETYFEKLEAKGLQKLLPATSEVER